MKLRIFSLLICVAIIKVVNAGIIPAHNRATPFSGAVNQALPVISYATPQVYSLNTAIAPLSPSSTGGSVGAYGAPTTLFSAGSHSAITVDASENVVSVNSGSNTLTTYNSSGTVITSNYPTSGYNGAQADIIDGAGNLYVSNYSANTVTKTTLGGVVTTISINTPVGLTVDASNNVYVVSQSPGTILKIASGTAALSTFLTGFNQPWGVAINSTGDLYVSQTSDNAIYKVSNGSTVHTSFATGFNSPRFLVLDPSGNLYVSDCYNSVMKQITPAGAVSTFISGLNKPDDEVFDHSGNFYISNFNTNSVLKSVASGYSVSPALPAGLYFNNYSGVIYGTPSAISAATTYTVTATNASGSATATVNITVTPAAPTATGGSVCGSGTVTLTASGGNPTGGTYNWYAASSGGTALQSSTSTTYTTPSISTTTTYYVSYTSSSQESGRTAVTATVNPLPVISYATPQTYTVGTAIANLSPTVSGGTPSSYTVSPALPAGLGLSTSTGVISGTPTAVAAAANYTITATTAAGCTGTTVINITVNPRPPAFSYASPQTYIISTPITPLSPTVTGGGVGSYGAVSTFETVNNTDGNTTDASGNVYTTSKTDNAVYIYNSSGSLIYTQNSSNGYTGAFAYNNPAGIIVDAVGSTYVTNRNAGNIIKTTTSNVITAITGFDEPTALAMDASGNIYVVDRGGRTLGGAGSVYKITGTSTTAGTAYITGLSYPWGIAVNSNGDLFISEPGASNSINTILKAASGSTTTTTFVAASAGLNSPRDMVFDAAGNLYEADAGTNTINMISPGGTVTNILTIPANPSPIAVSFDNSGNMYISGYNYNALYKSVASGYSISPSLPAGLNFNAFNGTVSGKPTATAAAANYTVTGTNASGNATAVINITVNPAAPTVAITGNPGCGSGSVTFTASAGSPSGGVYNWYSSPAGSIIATGTTFSPITSGTYYVSYVSGGMTSAQTSAAAVINPVVSSPYSGAAFSYSFSGNTNDVSGNANNGLATGSPTLIADRYGAASSAYSFNGSSQYISTTASSVTSPTVFSISLWFNTTTAGGKLIGFGSSQTGGSSSYDRHLYMSTSGQLYFGIYNGSFSTINTTAGYNDGNWHHVVVTQGAAGVGTSLYVDGLVQASNTSLVPTANYTGYWRIGYDALSTSIYTTASPNPYFTGTLDDIAVYNRVLTNGEISSSNNLNQVGALATVCAGSPITFNAPTITGATYTWHDSGSGSQTGQNPTFPSAVAGNYTLTVTGGPGGCSSTATVSPTVNAVPVITYATPQTYTVGTAITSLSPTSTGAAATGYAVSPALPAGLSLSTATGAISGTATVAAAAANYTVTATAASGCTGTAVVNITVTPPAPTATGGSTCGTGTVTLTASGGNPSGGTYNWYSASSGGTALQSSTATTYTTPSISATTIYYVSYTSSTVESSRTAVTATVNPLPVISYATPQTYTIGTAITSLSPTVSGGAPVSYSVSPALPSGLSLSTTTGVISGTPTTVSAAANYAVTATTASGCTGMATVNITVQPTAPSVAVSGSPGCGSGSVTFTASAGSPSGGVYNWYSSPAGSIVATGTTFSPITSGTYYVSYVSGGTTSAQTSAAAVINPVVSSPYSGAAFSYSFSGSTNDVSGNANNGVPTGSPSLTTDRYGAAGSAYSFNGSSQYISSTASVNNPNVFTLSLWFNTTTAGGKLIGFGSSQTGASGSYDRHIYMSNSGQLYFGIYPGSLQTINTTGSYNDGTWHHVVVTMGPDGSTLYVDGTVQAANASMTTAQNFNGYWRIGYDNTNTWTNQPTNYYFTGKLDDIAVYNTELTATQIMSSNNLNQIGALAVACAGTPITFNAPTITGATYTWHDSGSGSQTGQNPTFPSAVAGNYTLTVTGGPGGCSSTATITPSVNALPVITYPTPQTYTVGSAITALSPTVSGGTPTGYSVSPALPSGLNLSTTTGVISGTATVAAVAANYTVTAATASGCTGMATVNITVRPAAPTATGGSTCGPGTVTLTASGGNPSGGTYNWYAASSGGTALQSSSATTYTTPSISSTTTYYVSYTSSTVESTRTAVTATVNPLPVISYATPQIYTVGTAIISLSPTVSGGTPTGYSVSPALPAGLSFSTTTGVISGTATVAAAAANYTVTATTASGCTGMTTVNITVTPPAPTTTGGSVCNSGTVTLTASGGNPSGGTYNWYVASSGGTALQSSTATTYTTPSISTTTTYYVSYTSSTVESSRTAVTATVNPLPVISYTTPQNYTVGTAISSLSPTVGGGTPTSYAVSPALPAGLSLSTTTGTISGTATVAAAAANYTVTATTASGCTGMATVNITVTPPAPTTTGGAVCNSGTVTLTASGGNPSGGTYNWYAASSGGTALQSSTATTYTTPSISSTTTYYVSYTSSTVESTRTAVTATVNPLPVISYATPQNYTVGTAITSLPPTVSGGTPSSYSVSPALPAGLSLSTTTGTISGTATVAAAAANYTVTATTASGCTGMATVNITVTPPAPTTTGGAVCNSGTVTLTASGGNPSGGTYNWYAASSGGTALQSSTATTYTTPSISSTTTYYVSYTSSTVESTRTAVTATVNPLPVISYATPQVYSLNNAIAPLSPSSTGGAVGGYGAPTTLFSASNHSAITVDASGNVVAVNYASNTLTTYNSTGTIITSNYPTSGYSGAQADIIDGAGNLYVSNYIANTVTKTTLGGVVTTIAINTPLGLTVDAANNLYVASQSTGNIYKIASGTAALSTFLTGFNQPWGIAINSTGDLYVGQTSDNVIYKINNGSTVHNSFATGFNSPRFLVLDPTGNVYVTDVYHNVLKQITPGGTVSIFISGLNTPDNEVFDPSGNLYIANYNIFVTKYAVSGYSINTALPAGLNINKYSGVIYGKPTAISAAANYTVTATTASGCTSMATVNITVQPAAPTTTGGSTCGPGTVTLTASGGNPSGGTYNWYAASSGGTALQSSTATTYTTPSISTTTTYYVSYTSSTVESTRTAVTATVNPLPVISYATPQTYTAGTAITSLSPTVSGGTPVSYSASPALPAGLSLSTTTGVVSGTATAISATANYTVTATTASGCTGMATVNITVQPAAPTATGGSTCGPGTVTLTASGGNPSGGTYNWYAASSGGTALQSSAATTYTTPSISTTTIYYVSYTSSSVESVRAGATATVNPVPVITYSTPQTYTAGTAIASLSPTVSGGTPASYSVSPALPAGLSLSTTTGVISGTATVAAAAANYVVTATTAPGCTGMATVNITVNPSAPSVAVSGSPGCGSGSVTFTASAGSPSGGVYNWYSSSTGGIVATGTTFSPITSGTYYVSYVAGGITSAQTSAAAVINPVVSSPYSGAVISYPFSGNTNDISGNGNNGIATGSPALISDRFGAANSAYSFNGSSQYMSTTASINNPNLFTLSLWFNTTTAGGKLIGFGSSQTGVSGHDDRHIYMSNSGQLYYGIYQSGAVYTINTAASYNDGNWHHVIVTMGTDGSTLYVDGIVQASNASMTAGENFTGYWRIGYDNLNGWVNIPSNWYFTGKLDDIAVYNRELSAAEISSSNNLNQIGYTSSGCAGNPITFTAPYIAGATYSWTDGTTTVTGQHATFASLGTGNYTLTVTGPGGCSSTATITPAIPTYTWTGSASTDPTNNNNWTYTTGGLANTLPPFDGTASLVIPNGLTTYPVLTANESIFNLTIASGAQFSLGGYTLNVGCNIYNSSTVSGGGILYGNNNSSQITWNGSLPNQSYNGTTTAGTGQTGNFTVNNSVAGTVTIKGGGLDIYNTLTMIKGNLAVGASPAALTLKSSAAQSASVAAIPAGSTITGNVTVERFVTGGTTKDPTTGRWTYRSYRLMSSPVNEGADGSGNYPYSLNYLAASTIITDVTSTYGTTAGNPSLYVYNEGHTPSNATFTSGTFDGVTDISETTAAGTITTTDPAYPTGKLYAGDGFMMYFRGDNINSLSGVPSKTKAPFVAPENVVFSTTGNLNQGTYSVTPWTGTAGLMYTTTNPGNAPVRGYNLAGNPYASSIDWSLFSNSNPGAAIYGHNVNPSIYLLNPRTSNYDVYSASTGISTGNASNVIPSGAGFYVQANNSSPTLTFTEAAKTSAQVTGNNLLMGRPDNQTAYKSYMRLKLVTDTVNYDDMVIGFNSSSTMKYNPAEDAKYIGLNAIGTIAGITDDSVKATVKWLPLPKASEERIIPLNVTGKTSGIHTLERTDLKQLPEIYEVWLMDKYKSDSLDIKHNTTYAFNLDLADTASYGSNRFKVVIRQDPALAIHLLNFTAAKASNGAQLVWKTENEQDYTSFTVERSTDNGKTFQVLGGLNSAGQGTYSFLDKDPQPAVDQYRLEIQDLDGTISYSKVIPLMYSSLSNNIAASGITIYPNPATSNVNLYIVNTAATTANSNVTYNITVVNSTGTVIKTEVSATPTWQYSVGSLIPGTYMIQVVNNIDKSLVGKGKFIKL